MRFFVIVFLCILGVAGSLVIATSTNEVPLCRTATFPTLMYHHVWDYSAIEDPRARNISVTPEEFESHIQQLVYLWYSSITQDEIRDNTVPCNSVMIIFDDGYYDNFTTAFPILEKYGYVANIAIFPAKIDESGYFYGDDIRKLQLAWWSIMSHSWTHDILTLLPQEALPYQIDQSRQDLENWFHINVKYFVYPWGYSNNIVTQEVQNAGYSGAFGTEYGLSDLSGDVFELKRINVAPGTSPEQLTKLIQEVPLQGDQHTVSQDEAVSQDTVAK